MWKSYEQNLILNVVMHHIIDVCRKGSLGKWKDSSMRFR
jgi:hypothetical protein